MPPRRDHEVLRSLQEKITSLEDTITAQQAKIQNLEASASNGGNSRNDIARAFKASDIPAYSGKEEERNSVTLRAFFYNLRKVAQICSFEDAKLLEIAEFRLQGKAASWMETLEENDAKPANLEGLRTAMFKEFVPANEKNKAKVKLVNLKVKLGVEEHISTFQDLVNVSQTPKTEVYYYFFMSLSNSYKEQFTKEFPNQQPRDIQDAYELARTISMAASWRNQDKPTTQSNKEKNYSNYAKSSSKDIKASYKSNDIETCGPCPNSSEKHHYFKVDRCTKCGKKGWSEPDHPCKKDKGVKAHPKE